MNFSESLFDANVDEIQRADFIDRKVFWTYVSNTFAKPLSKMTDWERRLTMFGLCYFVDQVYMHNYTLPEDWEYDLLMEVTVFVPDHPTDYYWPVRPYSQIRPANSERSIAAGLLAAMSVSDIKVALDINDKHF